MTSISLHPTPSARTVAGEQFRAVGLALRTEAIFFVSALIILAALIIGNVIRGVQTHPAGHWQTGFTFSAPAAIPIFLVALLIPFGVWRSEDPSRRAYHWSMPVARGPHTAAKLLAGWTWTMIATIVYLLFIVMLGIVLPMITGEPLHLGDTATWEWIVAFTAPTIGYLLTSTAVIGSDHAWRWLGGLYLGYWVLLGTLMAFGMQQASYTLAAITDGAYGLNSALFGTVSHALRHHYMVTVGLTHESMSGLSMTNWLIAMPLWMIGAGIAVAIMSYRHRE